MNKIKKAFNSSTESRGKPFIGLTTKPPTVFSYHRTTQLFLCEKSFNSHWSFLLFAVWTGFEPATPCVTGMYSNQLNYQTNILWTLQEQKRWSFPFLRVQIYIPFLSVQTKNESFFISYKKFIHCFGFSKPFITITFIKGNYSTDW